MRYGVACVMELHALLSCMRCAIATVWSNMRYGVACVMEFHVLWSCMRYGVACVMELHELLSVPINFTV